MEHPVQLLINLLFVFISCSGPTPSLKAFNIAELEVIIENGIVLTQGKPFSGKLFALNNTDTLFIKEYRHGLEHGLHKSWYMNKQIAEIRYYQDGKKIRVHSGFWENGQRKFVYNFANDLYEDTQYEWYPTGRQFAKRNYKNGHENGLQKVWDIDGKLRSNYEAKNGRNYGNIGKKNCLSKT